FQPLGELFHVANWWSFPFVLLLRQLIPKLTLRHRAVVIGQCGLKRRLDIFHQLTRKNERNQKPDHEREDRLDERRAELIQMLDERHLRAFEQIFVVLAMHGEMTGPGSAEGGKETAQVEIPPKRPLLPIIATQAGRDNAALRP